MLNVLGLWKDPVTVPDALLISLIAITIVFMTLIIVIVICWAVQKGMQTVDTHTQILPRKENEILSHDKDAVAAALAAVIDFHRETGKDARIVSIKKTED